MHQEIPYANGHATRLSAREIARGDLAQITIDITATPPELIDETVRLCAMRAQRMVDDRFIDKAEAVDAIWKGCANAGVLEDRGLDAVQQLLADAFGAEGGPTETGDERSWPQLPPAAARGLAGALAKAATTHSEADPVAIMLTALTSIGALMGRARFIRVGETCHHARLMTALVGETSRARKGTSWAPVHRVIRCAETIIQSRSTSPFPLGRALQITHGPLSSGEGLISAIRDALNKEDTGGTDDKRLLVMDGELGAGLRAMQRQGNTLSMVLRTAWDGPAELAPLIKRDRTVASNPHICVIGHITMQELRALLNANDVWGGLVNRVLWACVRRHAIVACPKPIDDGDANKLAGELARVAVYAHERPAELRLTNSAADHWAHVYPELTRDRPGLLGAATARAEAQVLRLALTYALIDGADLVEDDHIEAALAMWRYSDDSANYLFGGLDDIELDPDAEKILQALTDGPKTQTQILDLFSRNLPGRKLQALLTQLRDRGLIIAAKKPTAGRPQTIWHLVVQNEKNERNELRN